MTLSGSGAKWLIGVAVVSLCVNLFLVGLMAGHWIYGPGMFGHGGPDGPRRGIEAMISGVPEGLRPMIKEKFDAAKPQFQAQREKIREVRFVRGGDPLVYRFEIWELRIDDAEEAASAKLALT